MPYLPFRDYVWMSTCVCVFKFNCFVRWWMFAFRMKSSNKLVHSLIHSSIGKEHEHPCDCVSEPNHRHCNVMRLVRCVMCVCNGITMYSHTMMGIVCFAPHVFLFFIFVYLSLARALSLTLFSLCHTQTQTISRISITMERATETQTESKQNTQNPI